MQDLPAAQKTASHETAAHKTAAPHWSFASIYGGRYDSADFAGKAILLVNTASLCGYTPQYDQLQTLHESFKARGLVVLAVPSDDFHQEKPSDAEVKDFCERNFGITLPMTSIATVKGPQAHPLYRWLADSAGFEPEWNFDKVLFDRAGRVAGTWRSAEEPMSAEILSAIEGVLARS